MYRLILVFVLVTCQLASNGQSRQKLFQQVDSLKAALDRADTLNPFNQEVENIYDTITAVNIEIAKRLGSILTTPATTKLNLDSLLQYPGLSITRSMDKRLWIFSWYENTGGSFHSYLNLVHYRTSSFKPKVVQSKEDEDEISGLYYGFEYDTIYPLKAPGKNLYLCLGRARTCNTCVAQIATVVELTKDSIRSDYPAFIVSYDKGIVRYSSSFLLESRIGSVEYFEFDTKTQTLSFKYTTDDNTPVQSEDEKVITRKLKFDGKKFIGNGYE